MVYVNSSFRTVRSQQRSRGGIFTRSLVARLRLWLRRGSLGMTLLAFTAPAFAADALLWRVNAGESHIRWEATQNDAAVKGGFETFDATVHFHPDALENSNVKVTVDTSTIFTSYDEAESTLKTKDWFFVEQFPSATFRAESFSALGEKQYRAAGTLTIKEQTVPITLDFTLHQFNESSAHITGETTLKRTDFNIGWQSTSEVADPVTVRVEIKASR